MAARVAGRGRRARPPPEQAVGLAKQVVDDGQLVGDLRATEHHGIRTLRVHGEATQDVDLGLDQATHRRRQSGGDVVDRGLLAVDDTEAVGDVGVGQAGERVGELGAIGVDLGGLAGVEAEVLQHDDVAVGHAGHRCLRALAHRVRRERDRLAEQLTQACRGRGEGVNLLEAAPGGRPEVGAHDDACARLGEGLDRRHAGAHPPVVGDRAPGEGDVEIGPDEDALAAQVAERGNLTHQ